MVAFRTTNKEINNLYDYVIRIGFCNLQSLLSRRVNTAYTCGVYGWNADVYDLSDVISGVAICTGDRPTGVQISYKLIQKYERKAEKIRNECSKNEKQRLNRLLKNFLKKAIAEIDGE